MAFEVSSVPLSLTIMQRTAAQLDDAIEFAGDPQAGERGVDDQRQAFPGEVVDHDQDAEAPAVASVSETKSSDQRWFGPCGIVIGARVPRARLRPPRLRTVSRSSR